ncbi:MAG TPA: bifunctional diguanylate cyclase/phosphodiesterase [Polyangiaceae bacterium]|nr:bifunctional diguanylate cyclase/phosphodiesterase [Polyangiaceae bacterium]
MSPSPRPLPQRPPVALAAALLAADVAGVILLNLLLDRWRLAAAIGSFVLSLLPLPLLYTRWYRPLLHELAERERIQRDLEHQGVQDALTQLPNRVWLQKHLAEAVENARRNGITLALILLDLRRFQVVNGTLGHATGDRLLEQVAARIASELQGADAAARLGADVFGILRHGVDPKTASQAAERLYQLMETPFYLDQTPIELEALCGVATFPTLAEDSVQLLQRAELALNQAKAEGERFAIYRTEKDTDSRRRLLMFGMLRSAVQRNELILHYQPKLHLASGAIIGAEALVRWDSPELGRVSPGEFIPLAEQTSLIKPLTAWVVEEALRQLTEWEKAGIQTRVAINLSARNLADEKLPEHLAQLLERGKVAPDRMMMEITESAVMANPERAAGVLERFREIGIELAIDDFGTGYSSLTYLRTLPARELKIDRSFVRDIDTNESNALITSSVIKLARAFGLEVVAEGVETEGELRRLIALGCDIAQGYLISRPMPASEYSTFLANHAKSPITRSLSNLRVAPPAINNPIVSAPPQSSVRPSLKDSLRSIRV